MKHINEVIKGYGPADKMAKDNNSCTVKSLSAAFEISFDDAHTFARKEWNRVNGRGVRTLTMLNTFPITDDIDRIVLEKRMKRVVATQDYIQADGSKVIRQMTLSTFCKKYPSGKHYILVSGHALVIDNGEVVDYTDKMSRRIKWAWRVS